MARLPRFFAEDQPLHIIQRGINRDPVFGSEPDYLFYLDCLERAAGEHGLAIHAYVLMTNHVHLLATPSHEESVPKTLQSVGRRYVQYFNYTYRRTGTLWEGRYRATVIDAETYLLTCMRYIELNPVRAQGMVQHPAHYPWSSYRANALGAQDSLLSAHEVYRRLGRSAQERQSKYRQLFRAQLSKADIEAIRGGRSETAALSLRTHTFRGCVPSASQCSHDQVRA
jgi:putative transposase